MKILFAIPKEKNLFGDDPALPEGTEGIGNRPHLGIAYLASFMKQHGISVGIYDDTIYNSTQKLGEMVNDFQPDIIGVTAFSYSYKYLIELIHKIKTISQKPIVVGGPHVSATKDEILKNSPADFAVKGEGEFTLLELLQHLQDDKPDFSAIKGLIWRSGNDIIENADREFITDVDSLPCPDFEAFPVEKYSNFQSKRLPVISSRGCPYACTFCSVRLSMGRGFRARTPENFVAELKHWYDKGWTNFEFCDDCYSADMKRVTEISDLIIKNGLNLKYEIHTGIRVDRVSPKLLGKLKESGCILVNFGMESGNEQILRNIRKNINLDQIRKAVAWANEAGIPNAGHFVIGHQGETFETAMDSIRFAKTLPTRFVSFYNLIPYPGTEVFEWAKKNGRFLVPLDNYLQNISYRDNVPVFETKEFTAEQRRYVMKKGFALYERKFFEFRLGKTLGLLAYMLARIGPVAKLGRSFISNNKIGHNLYFFLSRTSRNQ